MKTYYQHQIIACTGCAETDAPEVEQMMRDYFGTLNGLSKGQFQREAKEAHSIVLFLRTPEGIAHMDS